MSVGRATIGRSHRMRHPISPRILPIIRWKLGTCFNSCCCHTFCFSIFFFFFGFSLSSTGGILIEGGAGFVSMKHDSRYLVMVKQQLCFMYIPASMCTETLMKLPKEDSCNLRHMPSIASSSPRQMSPTLREPPHLVTQHQHRPYSGDC